MTRKYELDKEYAALQTREQNIRADIALFGGRMSEDGRLLLAAERHRINNRLQILKIELDECAPVDVSGHDDPYLTVCEGAE